MAKLIFGAAESKDLVAIFKAILPVIGSITFVPIQSERRISAGEMTEAFVTAGGELEKVKSAENLSEALTIGQGRMLVAGSLFLVGEVRAIVEGGDYEVSLQ